MKKVITGLFAALFVAAAPAWAHHGHGHSKHWDKHVEKQLKKERKAWEKQQKHLAKHGYYADQGVVYYEPVPRVIPRYRYVEPVRVYSPPVYSTPVGTHIHIRF